MIKIFSSLVISTLLFVSANGQSDIATLVEAQSEFAKAASEQGMRAAFLKFLSRDATVFLPEAKNGRDYWNGRDPDPATSLVRTLTFADISANGLLGYTTGNWRTYQKGKTDDLARFGQYMTIWEKKPDGKFQATLDIVVTHEKLPFPETEGQLWSNQSRDPNKRGWSPADASMNFLRESMSRERLGGAYKKFAADDVRLLRDDTPPIIGKKRVVEEMKDYVSIIFPTKVALFQAADMAYTWNPCSFDNSNEGQVQGNCVHVWKLRKKKWWIVLGVFAPIPNTTPPVLKRSTNDG